jgi:predicted RNA binding protein YcfA (HicA-like mRNA interferase family)
MPSPVRFAEIKRLFNRHGWTLDRTAGSHYVFKSPTGQIYPVPVHNGLVNHVYFRAIKKLLAER